MKAIILAAGVGSRLRPMTNKKPKTLVEVNGKPMLGFILEALIKNGIDEIILCTGYKSEQIVNFCETNYPMISFVFVENKEYEDSNNMYSLFLAKKYLNDDILLMNADLVFDKEIIKGLMKCEGTAVAVDEGRFMEESMKVVVEGNIIRSISKKVIESEAYGCSIDIYKIGRKDVQLLVSEMRRIIERGKDRNQWTEVMLDNLFSSGKLKAKPYNIGKRRWYEIDNYDDLASAELLFNEALKKLSYKKIFFIDRDGTLTLGDEVIPGATDFLAALKKKKKKVRVVTNNSSRTPTDHLNRFRTVGLNLSINDILVSTMSAVDFLKEKEYTRVFWIANKATSNYLSSEGLAFDDKDPQAVLLTYDDEIDYQKIKKAIAFIRSGTPYYATHTDMVCPTKEGPIPDIGTFIEMIRLTTGFAPNKTFGKPNRTFVDPLLRKSRLSYGDAVVIGDRLYTDVSLAERSAMTSILVLTGETDRGMYEESEFRADVVTPSLGQLVEFL